MDKFHRPVLEADAGGKGKTGFHDVAHRGLLSVDEKARLGVQSERLHRRSNVVHGPQKEHLVVAGHVHMEAPALPKAQGHAVDRLHGHFVQAPSSVLKELCSGLTERRRSASFIRFKFPKHH